MSYTKESEDLQNESVKITLDIFFLTFYFLAIVSSMWDLCSLTRDQTCVPALEVWSLNHWITREVPVLEKLNIYIIDAYKYIYIGHTS